ncbi:MAG TPA: hypothetical protein VLJ79_15655 [Candidatus Binatia bacterium]|nr:hypothetical protein [Candidatus Binatia bacterium]
MKVLTLCPADSSGLRGRAFWSTRPALVGIDSMLADLLRPEMDTRCNLRLLMQNTQNFRAHDDDVRDRQVMRHVFQGRRSV